MSYSLLEDSSPAGGANSAPPNPLAGFKGPHRGGERSGEREGREMEKRDWTNHPPP